MSESDQESVSPVSTQMYVEEKKTRCNLWVDRKLEILEYMMRELGTR